MITVISTSVAMRGIADAMLTPTPRVFVGRRRVYYTYSTPTADSIYVLRDLDGTPLIESRGFPDLASADAWIAKDDGA